MASSLTPRQHAIAVLLGRGYSPYQIARAIRRKHCTVYQHMKVIAKQLTGDGVDRQRRPASRLIAVWAARNLDCA